MQGATGLAHATGEPHGRPLTIPVAFFDMITGLHGLNAFHVGLRRLAETGQGDCYKIALEQVAFQTLAELGWYAQAETTGESREPIGDNLLDAVHGHYATRDGKFVTLNLIGDSVLRRLREATGMKTLAYDPQGHEIHGDHARYLVVEEIKKHIADWIGERTQDEALRVLQRAGLVAEPCRDSVEAEEYTHRLPCFHDVDDPDLGPIWTPRNRSSTRGIWSRSSCPGLPIRASIRMKFWRTSWVSTEPPSPSWNDKELSPDRDRTARRGPCHHQTSR